MGDLIKNVGNVLSIKDGGVWRVELLPFQFAPEKYIFVVNVYAENAEKAISTAKKWTIEAMTPPGDDYEKWWVKNNGGYCISVKLIAEYLYVNMVDGGGDD